MVETAPSPRHARRAELLAVAALFAVALAQGFFALICNHLFYAKHAPFYDSLSYDNALAVVLTACRDHGFVEGLRAAVNCSTVALPYILAALVGKWATISRGTGVWLHVPWVFGLLISCYSVFRSRLRASPWMAFFLALPFTSISAIYFVDGGLSDFRMDLDNYLMFGCSVCWFVIATRTERIAHWIVCGAFIGLAALARATSPVFLALTLGGIFVIRLALGAGKRTRLLLGGSIAAVTAALIAGWFFFLRFRYLYYYYVMWNPDANAHLPLRKSIAHFSTAYESTGAGMVLGCIAAVAVTIPWRSPRVTRIKEWAAHFPWEFSIAALVPAGFLAARGAGPNPFVSMPSVFGLVAVILGARCDWSGVSRFRGALAAAILIVACGMEAFSGYKLHAFSDRDRVSGFKAVLKAVQQDARERHITTMQMSPIAVGSFCADALFNVLVFNQKYSHVTGMTATNRELTISTAQSPLFNEMTYAEWLTIPGTTDVERIDHLARTASVSIDYIFIPTEATLKHLEALKSNYVNHYTRWLAREILANPEWKPISGEIPITPLESYTVYANRARVP